MVIRRIREHVAAQNWFAVGIDFLIVVVGIIIGTQVNNWNQARIERGQGSDYRDRLITEIRSNETDYGHRQYYYREVKRHAEAALAALDRTPQDGDAAFLIAAYQASQITFRKIKRFTYDELLSTGGIERLGDAQFREQIANYYTSVETGGLILDFVPPYREHLRQVMPHTVQRAIRTNCPESLVRAEDGSAAVILPTVCALDLDPATVAEAAAAIRASPAIRNDLTRLLADLDAKLWLTAPAIENARQARALIVNEQRRGSSALR